MKKKTKELLIKIGVGLITIVGSGLILFSKKKKKKAIEKLPKNKDNKLFI